MIQRKIVYSEIALSNRKQLTIGENRQARNKSWQEQAQLIQTAPLSESFYLIF